MERLLVTRQDLEPAVRVGPFFRVAEVQEAHVEQVRLVVAQHAAEGRVRAEEPVVGGDERHPDRRFLEGEAEQLALVAQGEAALKTQQTETPRTPSLVTGSCPLRRRTEDGSTP